MVPSRRHNATARAVRGVALCGIAAATVASRAEGPTATDFHLDWATGWSSRDATDLGSLLDRTTGTVRLAFAVDGDLAEADLGAMPLIDGWSVSLESTGRFFQEAMPPGFASAGGPTPFSAGAVAGRDLLAGVKATGRTGLLEYGVMTFEVGDAGGHDGPDQLGVGRVVVDMAEGLRVGAIATAGDARQDGQSYLVGTDLTLTTDDLVEGRALEAGFWVQRSMAEGGDDGGTASDGAIGFRVAYPNDRVRWSLAFTQVGDEFEAPVGSVPRRGVRDYSGLWHCRLRPGGLIRTIETGVEASVASRLDSDEADERIRVSPVAIELASSDRVRFDYIRRRATHVSPTRVGPRLLPPGEYAYERYEVTVQSAPSRPVRFDVRFAGGQYYTGDRLDAAVAASWQVTPAIRVTAGYEHADIEFEDAAWTSRVVRGNVNIALARTASWTNAIWYDHVNGTVGVDGRLRWEIEPGNEVVLNVSPRFTLGDASPAEDELGVVTSVHWSRAF